MGTAIGVVDSGIHCSEHGIMLKAHSVVLFRWLS